MNFAHLEGYKNEVEVELHSILAWWMEHTVDAENGGFYGKVNNDNSAVSDAAKGLVLNARILYTFSAAYSLTPNPDYLTTASRAFDYLIEKFLDQQEGGFNWSVDCKGAMVDSKKQIYGQAFAMYGFAEYYKISQDEKALTHAKSIFSLLEKHSFDHVHLGYLEAFTKDWQPIEDLRLSDKDQNEKKTMNTHLHVIEAYTNLYMVWKDEALKIAIERLLNNFSEHIINPKTNHLNLFFTEEWEVKSTIFSYGHDIEAAWLLQEAAEIIAGEDAISTFRSLAIKMTDSAAEGLAKNSGLHYELNTKNAHLVEEFHWWPQAEAMVGFLNAWQISGDAGYLTKSLNSWNFVKNHLKDNKNGEWFWGVKGDRSLMQNKDKAGFWKCPYHNGRACIEIIKRISLSERA